jgi:hypothetical protein
MHGPHDFAAGRFDATVTLDNGHADRRIRQGGEVCNIGIGWQKQQQRI